MKKYLLLTICFSMIQLDIVAQNTWIRIQPGMNIKSMLLKGDTLITAGNAGNWDYNYININYVELKSGEFLGNDSILFVPDEISELYHWNTIFYKQSIIQWYNKIIVGNNYLDKSGSIVKRQNGLYSINDSIMLKFNLNKDTFTNYFINLIIKDSNIYVINQWTDPDHSGKRTPNFEISSIDKWGNKQVVYQAINKNRATWNMIRGLSDDNQSEEYFFINRERAWDFAGVPRQYEHDIVKLDTNGQFIWSGKLNYSDSFNMAGCQFIQKNNGNVLAIWNNMYYRPYKHPEMSVELPHLNDSCSLHFAEIDCQTGKVIKKRDYRQYLNNQMTNDIGYPKSEAFHDFILEDAIKVNDGIIWTGTRTFHHSWKEPYSIDMPFLFKTDLNGNPIWYRDYFVFPDSETDEGMLVSSILQTPDGGFVMAGENLDFSRTDVQRSILVKVDSFGCLIPGCQLKDNINETLVKKCELYPNPATSSFTITLPNAHEEWAYQIMDNTGKTFENGTLNQEQNQIATQNLPKGIYQIILQNPKTHHHENHSFIIAK